MPPQQWLERKSTGLVILGMAGNRSRKSSSAGSICLFMSNTWKKMEGRRGDGPMEGRVGRKGEKKGGQEEGEERGERSGRRGEERRGEERRGEERRGEERGRSGMRDCELRVIPCSYTEGILSEFGITNIHSHFFIHNRFKGTSKKRLPTYLEGDL